MASSVLVALVWWPLLCHGFVLMSSPAAGSVTSSRQFELGTGHLYRLESIVTLNEPASPRVGKDVGYLVSGSLSVATIWQSPLDANDKLLQLQLSSLQLHIKSRKAPEPEGFVVHTSKLETSKNLPYFVHWNAGKIEHLFVAEGEDLSMVNLKKGVASLLQFQILDVTQVEKDASGKCQATYKSLDPRTFIKTKTDCISGKNVPFIKHPDKVLGTVVTSNRQVKYLLSQDLSVVQSAVAEETHNMVVEMRQDAGGSVQAKQSITITDKKIKVEIIESSSFEEVIQEMENKLKDTFIKQILVTEREYPSCQEDCPTLQRLVRENHDHLKDENLGTSRSAAIFIKLLHVARESKMEDIYKVLKSSKNKDILMQLCDLAGATQTLAAHEAARKFLHLDSESDIDINERYFWALSLGSHPHLQIIKDVLKLTYKDYPDKLSETLVLTVAALTNRFMKLPGNSQHKVIGEVKAALLNGLSNCQNEECKQKYLRALKNLSLRDTVPDLLEYALKGTKKTSVAAMKALKTLPPDSWDDRVKKACLQIYFQLGKRYDSSSRTLAADILLESNPSQDVLRDLLLSLASVSDSAYEVRQYLVQRMRQISERDSKFREQVRSIIREEHDRLNNYHVQAQRGLSTAFTRSFFSSASGNGSLVTVQEISGGLLKRGIVDVVLDTQGVTQEIFRLGLFAGGLSSFLSSDEDNAAEPDEPDEPATAGMEVTALGVQVRPFVFFSGQGELMGHVWSGSGSEKTPAFQTLALLQDHLQYLPLQNGFIAELTLLGVVSFDLSGQIQLSLWNRNAHSLVEFNIATEAKLNLVSDIDFYSNIALCLQLRSPDSIVKHNIYKVERIPGSKHRLRKAKYKVIKVPGKTYALNRKNNEMCGVIFKE
ncbi:hypothetical protein L9F63_014701 [Diploptera punctata]|uniref:Vitellogenin domain-containing protein n=1 Tax=Diploptera punctata TaxID=6984 RepID=A0AAD8EKL8_DIPPU|nr:hypothetical protein L9F63_014701 [Diploptera punctata]